MYKGYQRFKQCQATIYYIDSPKGDFVIFYSYRCPKIFKDPNGTFKKFTFENSRKAGEITGSRTTTKQCNQRLRTQGIERDYRELESVNLAEFEKNYFDTRQDFYY